MGGRREGRGVGGENPLISSPGCHHQCINNTMNEMRNNTQPISNNQKLQDSVGGRYPAPRCSLQVHLAFAFWKPQLVSEALRVSLLQAASSHRHGLCDFTRNPRHTLLLLLWEVTKAI